MAQIEYMLTATKDHLLYSNPHVHITLNYFGRHERKSLPLLSPELINDTEIDVHVDMLIEQLNRVRKNAKKALSKAKVKQQQLMKEKRSEE